MLYVLSTLFLDGWLKLSIFTNLMSLLLGGITTLLTVCVTKGDLCITTFALLCIDLLYFLYQPIQQQQQMTMIMTIATIICTVLQTLACYYNHHNTHELPYSGKFSDGKNFGNLLFKAISEIKFQKLRVESLEKSMRTRTMVTYLEIYFRKLLHFSKISKNFSLRKFPAIQYWLTKFLLS